MEAFAALAECVVCSTHMTECFHYPVRNLCECTTRICQSCRQRIKRCPTCRHDGIGTSVDDCFLDKILLSVKGCECQGCSRFILSRHVLKHFRECPSLLQLRLKESMDDGMAKDNEYGRVLRENEILHLEINDMGYQINTLRQSYYRSIRRLPTPPPPPESPAPDQSDDGDDDDDDDDDHQEDQEEEDDEASEDGMEVELEVHHLPPQRQPPETLAAPGAR